MALLKRFLSDLDGPKVFGQPQQGQPPLPPQISTNRSSSNLRSNDQPVASSPTSFEESTRTSTSRSPSVLSRQVSQPSTMSTAPSDRANSLDERLATMSIQSWDITLPCLLRDITGCPVSFPNRQDWYSHSKSHYGAAGPPSHALCIFCNTAFDSDDPSACWSDRMNHIADHFERGHIIEHSRPDFRVIQDMRDKNCISEEDYRHCFSYTERPYVKGLQPHDWIPEEIQRKERIAAEKANRVIVTESRQEARDRIRGKRLAVIGSKKSKSKSNTIVRNVDIKEIAKSVRP